MTKSLSDQLFERAESCIPGGVNSPVRAWKAVGGNPLFIRRARGARVWDVDGREYLDFVGSWGPMILGHAHPEVLRAVQAAMRDGTSFGAPTHREVDLAERLVDAVPSMDMVRLVSSGTEATSAAIRLARGATGRSKVLKFAGCYHGHVDALLVKAGSGAATFTLPDSAGVPRELTDQTVVADYNDRSSVERILHEIGPEIAAIIVEPVVGNMGVIPPAEGFLETLREAGAAHGALLIFDEVISGFRLHYGCYQQIAGIEPDITCLGKIVGGGLPLAAFGGKRDLMTQLAPQGPVYQAGTLSGNPLAVTAGLATLEQLRRTGVYEKLEAMGSRLETGLREALQAAGVRGCVNRVGSMWTLFFGVDRVASPTEAGANDGERFAAWFRGMLEQGIYLPPSPYETAFLSLAHGEADVDRFLAAARTVLRG